VRQHQRAGGLKVAFRAEALRQGALFFRGENRKPIDRVDVGLEAARGIGTGIEPRGIVVACVCIPQYSLAVILALSELECQSPRLFHI